MLKYHKSRVNVAEATRLAAKGWTITRLAERYGVSKQRVGQLVLLPKRPATCGRCGQEIVQVGTRKRYACGCKSASLYVRCECGRRKARKATLCCACRRASRREIDGPIVEAFKAGATVTELHELVGGYVHFRILRTLGKGYRRTGPRPPEQKAAARIALKKFDKAMKELGRSYA